MRQVIWRDTFALDVPTEWPIVDGEEGVSALGLKVPGVGEMKILCARREADEDDDDTELAYMLAMDAAARHDWDLDRLRIAEFAVHGCPAAEVAAIDGQLHRRVWHIVGPERIALITLDSPIVPEGAIDLDVIDRVVRSVRWLRSVAN